MKFQSRFLFNVVLLATLAPAAAHAEPRCVVMKFFDSQHVIIPTGEPQVAMIIGGNPAMSGSVPNSASRELGAEVPCPAALIAEVQKLFDDSCPTEKRRKDAVTTNHAPRAMIDKGCADMAAALKH